MVSVTENGVLVRLSGQLAHTGDRSRMKAMYEAAAEAHLKQG
jgi:hypothetical protein